jgi:long-chain acyl-CoA synthetase
MNTPTTTQPWTLSERDKAYLARLIDYNNICTVPEIWPIVAQHFGNTLALHAPHAKPSIKLTYRELLDKIHQFGAGLQALGIQAAMGKEVPTRIALFADNSPRWFIADQGIMAAGAANAVRSSQADLEELLFILQNSGAQGLVVENRACFDRLSPRLQDLPLEFVIFLTDEPVPESPLTVLNFCQLMEKGSQQTFRPVAQSHQALATLIYTSGTTGKPKGVMLSHGNLLHQVNTVGTVVQPFPGDRLLSILPSWHSYERAVEYYMLSQGCTQIYTNIRNLKKDFKTYAPQYMASVPRIWESIYEGVQQQFQSQPASKQKLIFTCLNLSQKYVAARRIWQNLDLENLGPSLGQRIGAGAQALALFPLQALANQLVYKQIRAATGGQLKQVISGGGSLATHLDAFYEMVGVEVLVGYGLTETSPILSARRAWHNLRGSSGLPLPGTEIKIVDPETRKALPVGERGLVLARGPQIMQGYFDNPTATAKAIDPQGWLDTGDLGMVAPQGDLVLTGRAKDTIVLSNGENIEPQPIEDACARSSYIDQIMLVGQDQKALGALIVPNLDNLSQWGASQTPPLSFAHSPGESQQSEDLQSLNQPAVHNLLRQELNREVKNRPGYRPDDRIATFCLITTPFSIENGMMTQTLKIRRPIVREHYQDMINGMFD